MTMFNEVSADFAQISKPETQKDETLEKAATNFEIRMRQAYLTKHELSEPTKDVLLGKYKRHVPETGAVLYMGEKQYGHQQSPIELGELKTVFPTLGVEDIRNGYTVEGGKVREHHGLDKQMVAELQGLEDFVLHIGIEDVTDEEEQNSEYSGADARRVNFLNLRKVQ